MEFQPLGAAERGRLKQFQAVQNEHFGCRWIEGDPQERLRSKGPASCTYRRRERVKRFARQLPFGRLEKCLSSL